MRAGPGARCPREAASHDGGSAKDGCESAYVNDGAGGGRCQILRPASHLRAYRQPWGATRPLPLATGAFVLSLFSCRQPELAIDFGTANLRLIRRDDGIVFEEPSLCCFADFDSSPHLVAAGAAAAAMVDRTHSNLTVKRPLRRGVLQDIQAATELLRYALLSVLGRQRAGGPSVMIAVPADATQAERSALMTAAREAGLNSVRFINEPYAAAVGAGLPIEKPCGTMIVECGAGTTEAAVISLGALCLTRSRRIGGTSLDQAITDYLHARRKFLVGALTAERIKQDYGAERDAASQDEGTITIKGRNLASERPEALDLPLRELDGVVEKHVMHIVDVIREILNITPPELSRDIHTGGIVLTGGSAVTPLLRRKIREETGLHVTIADDPARCVATGLHRIMQA